MAKKKSKAASIAEGEATAPASASTAQASTPSPASASASTSASATASATTSRPPASSSSLVICRNKHWRFISAFHGPWLQMPLEILETIANINYNTPRPRPIDPAAFFDLVKVRRLVDEATNLAVRAASDIASPILTNVNGGIPDISALHSLGLGGSGHGAKLSRERKFRMREQASQKLARAYRLDEIACSVATMQGASPLEEVGSYVLQRNQKDPDANYVHFFHEKIPSRQLAESTSLQPLTDIISERPGEPEALRTRATVRVFKEDHEGAALDLTHALQICRYHWPSQTPKPGGEIQLHDTQQRPRRRPQDVILAEKDQPRSLEAQILFQRASVYLTMACSHVAGGIPTRNRSEASTPKAENTATPTTPTTTTTSTTTTTEAAATNDGASENSKDQDREASPKEAEARKAVKMLAKRALRDYMAFIAYFEYSPNLPIRVVRDFNERVNSAAHGTRYPRVSDNGPPAEQHVVYPLSDLFGAVPPTGLPPYPPQDLVKHGADSHSASNNTTATTCEWTTFHPLLADALHSLLLCHCLAQTSTKELQRHAYMVARLVRLCDGYPIFQASRSPARSDWMELLRKSTNWLPLQGTWELLCMPAPLPIYDTPVSDINPAHQELAVSAAAALINGDPIAEERRKERVRERAILEALDDERVVDEASFRASILAREKRAEEEHSNTKTNGAAAAAAAAAAPTSALVKAVPPKRSKQPPSQQQNLTHQHNHLCQKQSAHVCCTVEPMPSQRWAPDDGKEYPILTDRAAAIARWIREAPVVTGTTTKRKKRTKKPVANVQPAESTLAMRPADPEES